MLSDVYNVFEVVEIKKGKSMEVVSLNTGDMYLFEEEFADNELEKGNFFFPKIYKVNKNFYRSITNFLLADVVKKEFLKMIHFKSDNFWSLKDVLKFLQTQKKFRIQV